MRSLYSFTDPETSKTKAWYAISKKLHKERSADKSVDLKFKMDTLKSMQQEVGPFTRRAQLKLQRFFFFDTKKKKNKKLIIALHNQRI